MSPGAFNPKIRFLGQKVCSVARLHTDRQTHRHTHTHESENRGHPFRVSWQFSFNLSSWIGPKISFKVCTQKIFQQDKTQWRPNYLVSYSIVKRKPWRFLFHGPCTLEIGPPDLLVYCALEQEKKPYCFKYLVAVFKLI